jgi:hypothetical protein
MLAKKIGALGNERPYSIFSIYYFVRTLLKNKSLGAEVAGKENNTDGIASVIARPFRSVAEKFSQNLGCLVSKMPKDYSEMQF